MPNEIQIEKNLPRQESEIPKEQAVEQTFDSAQKIEQVKKQPSKQDIQQDLTLASNQDQSSTVTTAQILHQEVENVLSEDMDSVYLSLDAGTQKIFKTKGEEVSTKITKILLQTKIKVKEITGLILEWLRIIPKVNKHYLEQEAKIKTEKILKINKQK